MKQNNLFFNFSFRTIILITMVAIPQQGFSKDQTVLVPVSDYNHLQFYYTDKKIDIDLIRGNIIISKGHMIWNAVDGETVAVCQSIRTSNVLQSILRGSQICINHHWLGKRAIEEHGSCAANRLVGFVFFKRISQSGEAQDEINLGGTYLQEGNNECGSTYNLCDGKTESSLNDYLNAWTKAGLLNPPNVSDMTCKILDEQAFKEKS